MQSSRVVFFVFAAAAAATVAACTEQKTVTDVSPAEAVDGVPDACFVRKSAPSPAVSDGDGGTVTGPVFAPEPIRCTGDADCGAGARCDKALSPPRCVTLYCVPEKGACSAAEQCVEGMKCHEGRCNPCNLCGKLCEVDLTSDPNNCGACGNEIAAAQTCVEGEATCPADRPTLCAEECVNTKTDPRHCGACNKETPNGGSCTKGKIACPEEQEICGGACVDTKTDLANCGLCGHVCPSDFECGGACYMSMSSTSPTSCNAVCQPSNLRCGAAAAVFTSPTLPTKVVDMGCSALPGAAPAGFTFNSVSCACVER